MRAVSAIAVTKGQSETPRLLFDRRRIGESPPRLPKNFFLRVERSLDGERPIIQIVVG